MLPTSTPQVSPADHPLRQELRHLLPLAGPIILSQLGQVGMTVVDTMMVGPLGAQALAAIGLGAAIHMFFLIVCSGVIFAMTPLISQAFGAGDPERSRLVLMQGLWLALLGSIPVVVTSLIGGRIALALGQDPGVSHLCGEFLWALAWGVTPQFAFMTCRQYLEGIDQARAPMVITGLGLLANIAANSCLIYGVSGWIPAMGAVGTGWATTTVRWVMCLAIIVYLIAGQQPFRRRHLRPDWAIISHLLRLGAPIGTQLGLELGLFSFAAVMMGWLGPTALAAHQVTLNIASTTFMVALGVSLAGAIRVGQHLGAGEIARVRHASTATYLVTLGFMSACAILFVSVPETLLRLYTPDAAVIALGTRLLLMAALFQVFDGAQVAGTSILRGLSDTRVPMIVGTVGYWLIGVPTAYVLAFHTSWGPVGVWAGLCAGLAIVAFLMALRVRRLLRLPSDGHVPIVT